MWVAGREKKNDKWCQHMHAYVRRKWIQFQTLKNHSFKIECTNQIRWYSCACFNKSFKTRSQTTMFQCYIFLWANTFYCILICLRLLQNLLVTLQCCLTRLSSVKWYWYFLRKWYWCWYWEDRLDGVIRGGWQPIVLGSRLMLIAWLVIGNFSKSIELFLLSLCWYFSILCK